MWILFGQLLEKIGLHFTPTSSHTGLLLHAPFSFLTRHQNLTSQLIIISASSQPSSVSFFLKWTILGLFYNLFFSLFKKNSTILLQQYMGKMSIQYLVTGPLICIFLSCRYNASSHLTVSNLQSVRR